VTKAAPLYVRKSAQGCPLPQMVRSLWLHGHGQYVVNDEFMKQVVTKTVSDVISTRPFFTCFFQ
jgi:hypothetical protein